MKRSSRGLLFRRFICNSSPLRLGELYKSYKWSPFQRSAVLLSRPLNFQTQTLFGRSYHNTLQFRNENKNEKNKDDNLNQKIEELSKGMENIDLGKDFENQFNAFQARLQLKFKNPLLLRAAVIHHTMEAAPVGLANLLEFFGDKLLGKYLVEYYANKVLGKNFIPSTIFDVVTTLEGNDNLKEIARKLGFADLIKYRIPNASQKDIALDIALADCFEACIAAIYLDMGDKAAKDFVIRHVVPDTNDYSTFVETKQPVLKLKRVCDSTGRGRPYFKILEEAGRFSTQSVYIVGAFSDGVQLGTGSGRSIKLARNEAAANALANL